MFRRSHLLLPMILAAVCSAQDVVTTPVRGTKMVAPIVSMSFRGGSMADFVAAVRAAEPKANIVIQAKAANAVVPAMEIKEAGLDQVLDSACAVAESSDQIGCTEQRGNGEPVFAIIARNRGGATTMVSSGDEESTIVLSLNRLTEGDLRTSVPGLRVETILSAIEASSHFDTKAPKLRYHQDSGLLFLRGTREQLSLGHDVLQILERDQQERATNALIRAQSARGNQQPADPAPQRGGAEKKDR
ncbi:MAG: hypothetical protein KDC98_15415 [Planctomycetes bacterium]|nr:hypothetical protein [Planctomycetota bacterium]